MNVYPLGVLQSLALPVGVKRTVRPSGWSTAVPPLARSSELTELHSFPTRRSSDLSLATTSMSTAVSSLVLALSSTATGASLTAATWTVTVAGLEEQTSESQSL